jgi:hypothetical protein
MVLSLTGAAKGGAAPMKGEVTVAAAAVAPRSEFD